MVPRFHDDDESDDDYTSISQGQDEDEDIGRSSPASGSEVDSEVEDPMDLDGWSSDEDGGQEVTAITMQDYHEGGGDESRRDAENEMQARNGWADEGDDNEAERELEADEGEDLLVRLTRVDEENERE